MDPKNHWRRIAEGRGEDIARLRADLARVTGERDAWHRQYIMMSEAQASALSSESEAVRRAESAELGCEIAYRREPTQAEGDAHEYEQHESMGPVHGAGECFVPMGGWTGRRCRRCRRWAWGGPTACEACAAFEAGLDRAEVAERDLARVTRERDALQRHYDAAAPEHNLLALLDLYHSREQLVIDRVSEWKRNFAGAKEHGDLATDRAEAAERELAAEREAHELEKRAHEHTWQQKVRQIERAEAAEKRAEEAEKQARLGWERAAEKDRAYGDMIRDRDHWRAVAESRPDISREDAAQCSTATIARVRDGIPLRHVGAAERISAATGGAVTVADLLGGK